jgi:lactonase family protein with 7-bladed beta-propeller
MGAKSIEHRDEDVRSFLPPLTRRAFLAGAASCAAVAPALLHAVVREPRQTLLHVATRASHSGSVHTFLLTSSGCALLGSTPVDSFAALAVHPVLPILYIARDCREWQALPRGVIETYAVARSGTPLRLAAESPMALSATGPRSLDVSPSGRRLLVSASTGGAWNAFALNSDGMPAPVAIARKETGIMLDLRAVSLPAPHGVVFSPQGPFALGTDPGTGCMTLLQPSSEAIAVLARCRTPYGLTPSSPVWTADARYIVVSNAQQSSLSIYKAPIVSGDGSDARFHLVGTSPTETPVTTLLAHPSQTAVFTSRPHESGSRLELWELHRSQLRLVSGTSISGHVVALARDASTLWAVSQDRLIRIPLQNLRADLRATNSTEVLLPIDGAQAIVTQTLPAHLADTQS